MKTDEHLTSVCPATDHDLAVGAALIGVLHDVGARLVGGQLACEDPILVHARVCTGRTDKIEHARQLFQIAADKQFCHELACGYQAPTASVALSKL